MGIAIRRSDLSGDQVDLSATPRWNPRCDGTGTRVKSLPQMRLSAKLAAMKPFVVRTLFLVVFLATQPAAQHVIPLSRATPPGSTQENYPEKEYFSKLWNTEVVANVTKPSLTVFKPAPDLRNGTAVVICPGGGFMALSITSEGIDVAKYLAAKGVTAFVLKYRLAHTGEDATQEFMTLFANHPKFDELVGKVVPLAVADGLAAVTYVRQHASEWGVSPDRVGIIGFSAAEGSLPGLPSITPRKAGRPSWPRSMRGEKSPKMFPFQRTHRLCLLRLPPMISSDSRPTALSCTRGGRPRINRRNCTCTRRVATASECASRTYLRIIGLTGSPIGWS